MKATLVIGGLFVVFTALFLVIDYIVALGMEPIGSADDAATWTPEQSQAVADGYAVLPPRPVYPHGHQE